MFEEEKVPLMNGVQYRGERVTGDFPIDAPSPFVSKFFHISVDQIQSQIESMYELFDSQY